MKLLDFSCRVHEGFRSAIGLGLARPELFSEYLVQMKALSTRARPEVIHFTTWAVVLSRAA